ncbi:MAG: hypothetical protein AAB553_05305 [Patescibacteria group bacterium]
MINVNEYHGYLALPRHSMLLLHELGYDLFGFYLGLVMCTTWHRNNKQFGRITKNQTELAECLNMTQTTVSRKFKELENHKYFILRSKLGYIPGYFPLFLTDVANKIPKKNYANLHELYADISKINAELQYNYANSQDKRAQNKSQRLYSSSNDIPGSSSPSNTPGEFDVDELDNDEIDKGIERIIKEREMQNKV